jgi:hypothetical protein
LKSSKSLYLREVSCVQYEPECKRTKDEAERIAILEVRKALQKRGYPSGIFQYALAHRNSGHIHLVVPAQGDDENLMCKCCKEVQKAIPSKSKTHLYKKCDCSDCVACDPDIRRDMEQMTRT